MNSMELDIKADDVKGETVFVPSSGKRGDGNRVYKTFPKIPSWAGVVEFTIFDHTITEEVFKEHLMQAGQFIGIGRWRPRNNGLYGRFTVEKVVWKENEAIKAALTSAANGPLNSLDYSVGFMMMGGGPSMKPLQLLLTGG